MKNLGMNQYKLPVALGMVILAGILVFIAKLNEQTKLELGNHDHGLTATKEDISKLRKDLVELTMKFISAEKSGALNHSELQREMDQFRFNERLFDKDLRDISSLTKRDLSDARRQLELVNRRLQETNQKIEALQEELARTSKELKGLKTAPNLAANPAAVTSSGQPK